MLLRVYRLTDKLSLALLKTLIAFSEMMTTGLSVIFGSAGAEKRGLLGILSRILGVVFRILGVIVGFVLVILGSVFNVGVRAGGGALSAATGGSSRAVGGAMARRAARAQMDAGVAEDPLRTQNRVLSVLFVFTLLALIAIVLYATRPQPQPFTTIAGNGLNLDNQGDNPIATEGQPIAIATNIPTATQLPEALRASGSVVYTVRQNGQTDLWAAGVTDSRNPIRLTNFNGDERDPAWSPDGRKLAFASNKDGNWDLYVYDLTQPISPTNPERKTVDVSFQANPAWSPDGFYLVYESYQGENLDIYVLAVDNSEPVRQLPVSSTAPDFSPVWSPDGRQIAFTSWMDGASQDIYVVNLDDLSVINLTNTPGRNEDHAAWYPLVDNANSGLITYSAVDAGIEKVFVKSLDALDEPAQVIGQGRTPAWSPDGVSIIAAVDTIDGTHMQVYPYTVSGLPQILPAPPHSNSPVWTNQPLPPALVNTGGLPDNSRVLYNEQVGPRASAPFFQLANIGDIDVEERLLNDQVNDSFIALREKTLALTGWDFLGRLDDAWWNLDYRPLPGEPNPNWHMTGRAFSINRAYPLVGFPPQVQVVREDGELNTRWRLYVRVVDEAQFGQLGEPLRHMPWDFNARNSGDVSAYEQGGRLRGEVPEGYFVDFTQVAEDFGWQAFPAGSDWRANSNVINYWMFYKSDGLNLISALREIWSDDQLGGYVPSTTPQPVLSPTNTPEQP